MFCWKKFHVLGIYVHFVFQKLGPRENLKIFQCFASLFFFCCCCFSFFFFCFFFFFVPGGKSSVSSLGCFCCFFLFKISCWDFFSILGVHHSRVRGSPMWCLKGFLGSQWLRARLCCRKVSDFIFWLYYFTPRWLAGAMPCPKKVQKEIYKKKR